MGESIQSMVHIQNIMTLIGQSYLETASHCYVVTPVTISKNHSTYSLLIFKTHLDYIETKANTHHRTTVHFDGRDVVKDGQKANACGVQDLDYALAHVIHDIRQNRAVIVKGQCHGST